MGCETVKTHLFPIKFERGFIARPFVTVSYDFDWIR